MSHARTTAASLPEGVTEVLVTHLLTTTIDPQRNIRWEPDPSTCKELFDSAAEHGVHVVLIHDEELTSPVPDNVTAVRVEPTEGDVYWRRWEYTLEFLRDHEDVIERVFCVDGSDVRVLRFPFTMIEDDALYVGSELTRTGDRWMVENHPHPQIQRFITGHAHLPLYNAGIVGGDRRTVCGFVSDLVGSYHNLSRPGADPDMSGDVGTDMGLLNLLLRMHYAEGQVITGPEVHTVYKRYQIEHPTARFAHK